MHSRLKSIVFICVTCFVLVYIFLNLIISPINLGGDFNSYDYEHFKQYSAHPYIWDNTINNGLGQYALFTLPFQYYSFLLNLLTNQIGDYFLLGKIVFLWPLIIIAYLSAHSLSTLFLKKQFSQLVCTLLYLSNPYFLMLTSGGQIGVAFAYAFAPFVLKTFLKILEQIKTQKNIFQTKQIIDYIFGALVLSLLISFDTRLALLAIIMIVFAYIAQIFVSTNKLILLKNYLVFLFASLFVVLSWHAYWILPSLFVHSVDLPRGYASIESVEFFSFARLAHSISWSHPNYPDNIFGKVNEVKGIELIFPLLAFSALFLRRKLTLFLGIVAAVSVFLIKGTNPPFGFIYNFIFQHLPGGALFRDSTKFFLPLSLAYSILIGLSIEKLIKKFPDILNRFNLKTSKLTNLILPVLLSTLILIAWWPTYSHQIQGTLTYRTFPENYNNLRTLLQSDTNFGRVLWIPDREIYGYTSLNHPAVSLNQLRQQPTCLDKLCLPVAAPKPIQDPPVTYSIGDLQYEIATKLQFLNSPDAPQILDQLGIQYIVLPSDTDQTIFQYDRKYSQTIKNQYSSTLADLPYLQKISDDNGLEIYKFGQSTGLFKAIAYNQTQIVTYTQKSPTEYLVNIPSDTSQITFAQTYNSNWIVEDHDQIVNSIPHQFFGNTFTLNPSSSRQVTIKFQGQKIADIGWLFSNIVLFTLVSSIIFFKLKSKIK